MSGRSMSGEHSRSDVILKSFGKITMLGFVKQVACNFQAQIHQWNLSIFGVVLFDTRDIRSDLWLKEESWIRVDDLLMDQLIVCFKHVWISKELFNATQNKRFLRLPWCCWRAVPVRTITESKRDNLRSELREVLNFFHCPHIFSM